MNIEVEGGGGVDAVSGDCWIGSSNKLWNFFSNGSKPAGSWASGKVRAETPSRSYTKSPNWSPVPARQLSDARGTSEAVTMPRPPKAKLHSAMGAPIAGSSVSSPRSRGEAQANACLQRKYGERLDRVPA